MMEAKEAMENWNRGISELFSIMCKKEESTALVCDVEPLRRKQAVSSRKSKAWSDEP